MSWRSLGQAILVVASIAVPCATSAETSASLWFESSDHARAHPYLTVAGLPLPNSGGILVLSAYPPSSTAVPRPPLATLYIVGTRLPGEHEATVRFRLDPARPGVLALLAASPREIEVTVPGSYGHQSKTIGPLAVADAP